MAKVVDANKLLHWLNDNMTERRSEALRVWIAHNSREAKIMEISAMTCLQYEPITEAMN